MNDVFIVVAAGSALSVLLGVGVFRRWQSKKLAGLGVFREACRKRFGFLEELGFEEKPECCSGTLKQDGVPALLVTYASESMAVEVIRTVYPSDLSVVLRRLGSGSAPDRAIEIESLLAVEAPGKTLRDGFGMLKDVPIREGLDFYAEALEEHGKGILAGDERAFAAIEAPPRGPRASTPSTENCF